jgi:hypothetical protein
VQEHALPGHVFVGAEHGEEIRPLAVVLKCQEPVGAREVVIAAVDLVQPVQRRDGDFVRSKTYDWASSLVRCVDSAALLATVTLLPYPSGEGSRK